MVSAADIYESDDDPLSQLWWNESNESLDEADGLVNGIINNMPVNDLEPEVDSEAEKDSGELPDNTIQTCTNPLDQDFLRIPDVLKNLRAELLGDYRCPEYPPSDPPHIRSLTLSEVYSLQHYAAWAKTNGTVEAYTMHAEVLSCASKMVILSLREVKKLAQSLVNFRPQNIDMCPRSCIAYTGKYQELVRCPYIPSGKNIPCNEPRYCQTSKSSRVLKPRAQVQILPIMARIQAMYANATTSAMMRNRDACLQQALLLMATASGKRLYSDYGNGQVHVMQHEQLSLFKDSRDVALALSTDGVQLTMKKQSNTWLVIFIFLNLPGIIRCKSVATNINFATPGPNPPGDIESYVSVASFPRNGPSF